MAKGRKSAEPKDVEEPVFWEDPNAITLGTISGQPKVDKDAARIICRGVTDPRKQAYLLALAVIGHRARAAAACNISPHLVYNWRRDDDIFDRQYNEALECAVEMMEDEAFRRGVEGVLKPIYQGGRLVGAQREFSDGLLMFTLKGARPDKYADRTKHEHTVDVSDRLRAARERALGRGDDN